MKLGFVLVTVLALCTVTRAADVDRLSTILVAGDDWTVAVDGLGFSDGACADSEGNLYFADLKKPSAIYKLAPDGTKTKVNDLGMSGNKIGPDGKLYSCGGGKLVSINLADGKDTVVAEGLKTNDLAVNSRGQIYLTETGKKQVTFVDIKTGQIKAADVGISKPNGIGFCPQKNLLLVSDYGGMNVWSFTVQPDGTLTDKKPWATMKAPEKKPDVAGGDGMTLDRAGRAYVTTALGLQVFDADGTLLGVIPKPQDAPLTNAAFAGKNFDVLYVTCGNKVFRRKTQVTGVQGYQTPVSGTGEKK